MDMDLKALREEIDSLDDEILKLLTRRAQISCAVGQYKLQSGITTYHPARERAILERLGAAARPPLTPAMIEALYNVIFSISRSLQAIKQVAYLGPEGSYSHQAALSVFSLDAELKPQGSIEDIVHEVTSGRADLGIVPVENSTEGMVNRTLDMMATARLYVCREIMLPIRHCLLGVSSLNEVKAVYSHYQPLAQCRNWLETNLPGIPTVETASTSQAAIHVSKNPGTAAIASRAAACIYGLEILADNINDLPDNITRFWVISRQLSGAGCERAKTSIIVSLENTPGALFNAIGVFAAHGLNLTKIESRPSRKGPWEYMFFVDFQGSLDDAAVQAALSDLRQYTTEIIILGSYPEGSYSE
ncbi:MAG: P-protein [Deltaproteobacteria bacterium ADurb.Bin510]|nr:MAG: P-protein [Deltaproteobacteria bacterium ADurb.Bin510]